MRVPFQFNLAFVTDPACVEYVLKTNYDNFVKGLAHDLHETRSCLFTNLMMLLVVSGHMVDQRMRPILGRGIFNTDGAPHKVQRQIASHLFTRKTLQDFMLQVTSPGCFVQRPLHRCRLESDNVIVVLSCRCFKSTWRFCAGI